MAATTTLLDILGKEDALVYAEKILVPEFRRLGQTGEVDEQALTSMSSFLATQGLEKFNPVVHLIDHETLSSHEGGFVGVANKQLLDGSVLKHVIKKNSKLSKEAIEYDLMSKAIKDSEFDHMLPHYHVHFPNKELLLTAFVNGDLLYDRIHAPGADKVALFNQVFDERRALLDHLGRKGVEFTGVLGSFTDFAQLYSRDPSFLSLYDKQIGSKLDKARTENAHMDFNLKNIILNGKSSWIDMSHAAGNGFDELDLYRAMNKADLTKEEQQQVIDHVAQRNGDESRERMVFTEITNLLRASEKYRNPLAQNLMFTRAMDAITKGQDMKVVGIDFREEVYANRGRKKILSPDEITKAEKLFQPNQTLSLEEPSLQSDSKLTLEESLGQLSSRIGKEKDVLADQEKQRKLRRKWTIGGVLAAAATLTLGTMLYTTKIANERLTSMTADEAAREISDHRLWTYRDMFKESFEEAEDKTEHEFNSSFAVISKQKPFNRYDDMVAHVADTSGIPDYVLRRVFTANNLLVPMFDRTRDQITKWELKHGWDLNWLENGLEKLNMIDSETGKGLLDERPVELFAPWLYYARMHDQTLSTTMEIGPGGASADFLNYTSQDNFQEGMYYFHKFWNENSNIEDDEERLFATAMKFYNPYNYQIFKDIGLVSGSNTDFCNIEYTQLREAIRGAVGTVVKGATSDFGGLLITQHSLYRGDVPMYCGDNYKHIW